MILGQIAWIDCIAFLIFLAPQLIYHVGLIKTAVCGIQALPFLLIKLPYQLTTTRYFTPHAHQPPFIQHATLFQDLVIRCVGYAFASIPARIGAVFLSKPVALPFIRFRMLRHNHLHPPHRWRSIHDPSSDLHGLSIVADPTRAPDVVLLYCHGGGFSMGSAYFYLEFLLAWLSLLQTEAPFSNPAIFALEYTLVPTATYPTQLRQTVAGYAWALEHLASNDAGRLAVAGDSAGATLILSLLLHLSRGTSPRAADGDPEPLRTPLPLPRLALPISPWTTLSSAANANTASDYLNERTLHLYGRQYLGGEAGATNALASPGLDKSGARWRRATPSRGWYFVFGGEEVFAPETREMVEVLRGCGAEVGAWEEEGWVHAWPVVKMFLGADERERLSGVRRLVAVMGERMGRGGGEMNGKMENGSKK